MKLDFPSLPSNISTTEADLKVISDFEDEDRNHPEISICPEKGLILFDIDGTLVDAYPIQGEAVKILWKKFLNMEFKPNSTEETEFTNCFFQGFGVENKKVHERLLNCYGIKYNGRINPLTSTEFQSQDELVAVLSENHSLLEGLQSLTQEQKMEIIISGVMEFLEKVYSLKIPMGIVTSNSRKNGEAVIKYLGLAKYFISGGYGEDSRGKGRPEILQTALKRCERKCEVQNISPDQIIVLGDTVIDSEAATIVNPHMHQVLVATGKHSITQLKQYFTDHPETQKPEFIINTLAEITLDTQLQIKQILG